MRQLGNRSSTLRLSGTSPAQLHLMDMIGVNTVKDPVPQTAPAGHPAAADPLSRHITPPHALAQDVDDAPQSDTVIHGLPPREAMPPRRLGRKQRGYPLPQVVRHKISQHPAEPAHHDPQLPADTPISF
jgi:hypothetical protein